MVIMPNPSPTDQMIRILVDRRFGLNRPRIKLSAERIARKILIVEPAIAKYEEDLRALTVEQLKEFYDADTEKDIARSRVRQEEEEAERFFNKPYARADFDHWSKMPYWTLDEAVALSLGKAPERVKWKDVAEHAEMSAFARNYSRRRDLAQRAVGMKQLTDGVVPAVFMRWAKQNDLPVPDELVQIVEKRGQTSTDWPTLLKNCQDEHAETIARAKKEKDEIFKWAKEQQEETLKWGKEQHSKALEMGKTMVDQVLADKIETVLQRDQIIAELNNKIAGLQSNADGSSVVANDALNPKSRMSLLKLVLGMAIDGYGYDPKESKSPLAKELVDRLAALGIAIDEDTVRRWLREAAQEVTYTSPIKSN